MPKRKLNSTEVGKVNKRRSLTFQIPTQDDAWQQHPETVKRFLNIRPDYEQLCTEVEYILRKNIRKQDIQTAAITSRAKTLNSFLEKLQRKQYDEPFSKISDLAGVRVVCLYRSDIDRVKKVINNEFEIIEEVDKLSELGVDKFGYGACHFIVRLGRASSGARYDDLKKLSCEIQVRTVVQDAWAIIRHHLVYKRESQVPKQLHRKLNSLAGLFETVDDQFERIREERESYLVGVRGSTDKPTAFLENELNLDSFREYLKWSLPNRTEEYWDGQTRMVLDSLLACGFKSLHDVDAAIKDTQATRDAIKAELGDKIIKAHDGTIPANIEAALALAIKFKPIDGKRGIRFIPEWEKVIKKHLHKAS